ncbi:MAG TPA: TRAP transporter fused permease subunit, partial [candidate division Zixibacteria bacterium]|nr:TRAP transporter fused permease subunit [candidate division Zixibacteria bacterium]
EEEMSEPARPRQLSTPWALVTRLMMGGAAAYFVWASTVGVVSLQYFRGAAVLYSLVVPILLYKARRRARSDRPSAVDVLLAAAATVSVVYWMVEHEAMAYRAGDYTATDVWMGVVATAVAIEAARRVLGWDMALCAVVPILYALFGNYLPYIIGHRGYSVRRVVEYVYLTSDGIFGIMAEVLAEYIIPFVAFGAFLERAGVAQFFIDISLAALGRIAGGPAQASVVSSALMGTISGSPIAETVTKGPITIPLMKRAGFPPHTAAAVEAAASTGGAIMPPVMGAGAFIMSEMTGIPYLDIIKVAAIPGILYFVSVGVMIYFESRKLGLRGFPREDLPRLPEVWRRGWYLLLPIAVLIGTLVAGYSPQIAALYGMVSTIAVSWLRKETRMGPGSIWRALVDTGRNCLFVAALTGAVGVLIGVLSLTGIVIRFPYLLIELAGESVLVTIALIACATFVLGLPLPITATYLIVAVVAVPALLKLGVPLISAHLIIFWLSLDSNITPPVAMGPFAAAAIAQADPMKTGWSCFRFAKIIYVMPLLFAYTHLLLTGTAAQNLAAILSATLGTVLFSIVSTAYFHIRTTLIEWLLLAAATALSFVPSWPAGTGAVLIFAAVYAWQRRRAAAEPALKKPIIAAN